MTTLLVTLPTHRVPAFSAETPLKALAEAGALWPPQVMSLNDVLEPTYMTDVAITQYAVWDRSKDEPASLQFRLKDKSILSFDSTICCRVSWLALDWDFGSKALPWGDRRKPESPVEVKRFIERHPILSTATAFYFSHSGVRVLFELETPFRIVSLDDVAVWRESYTAFVHSLGDMLPDTKIELGGRSSPFALSRVPRYRADGRDTSTREIVYLPGARKLALPLAEVEAASAPKTSTASSFAPLDQEEARRLLWTHPLIRHLRENRVALSYSDWRALGTNIYALFGEEGESLFRDISSWDAKSDPRSVGPCWLSICQSAEEGYGPVRWANFQFNYERLFKTPPPATSSLAGAVRRRCRRSPPSMPPPEVDEVSHEIPRRNPAPADSNAEEVKELLRKNVRTLKDGTEKVTIKKDLENLKIILREDNRWGALLRRNHLGSIDMCGDERIVDELVTLWRAQVVVSYGLSFSKDDFWEVIKLICWQNEYNPIFDYLHPLKWDGTDRFGELARRMGQTEPLAETLLRKFFISAVVRPLEWMNHHPSVNWKVDTCLILKGKQGYRKSSFFKALVPHPHLFSDSLPNIQLKPKDASLHMLGRWIIEQAEFEGHVQRSSIEAMKAFITRESEDFRKHYGRAETHTRRPSVLVGTTNSDQFLNDPTGDRRFWVIELPKSTKIDLAWVQRNRDQLWAQAVSEYNAGAQWWLTDAEDALNSQRNDRYRRLESYKELVDEFLMTDPVIPQLTPHANFEGKFGFSMRSLSQFALEKKMIEVTPALLSKISTYVGQLGWERTRASVGKSRMWCYRKRKVEENV